MTESDEVRDRFDMADVQVAVVVGVGFRIEQASIRVGLAVKKKRKLNIHNVAQKFKLYYNDSRVLAGDLLPKICGRNVAVLLVILARQHSLVEERGPSFDEKGDEGPVRGGQCRVELLPSISLM